MRILLMLLIACISSNLACAQIQNCNQFKTGVFQLLGYNGGVYTIIRTDSTQFERNSKQAHYSKMKIKWTSDCSYTLFDRTEYRRGKPQPQDTLITQVFNVVYNFEKPNKFYVQTFVPGYPDTTKSVLTKLDTTNYYNNLFQRKEFAEYKDSGAYGQTLLGEIHSIDYYESTKIPNKYLIAFETTYHGETMNKSTLLASTVITIRDNENITNSNCRFNDKFDDEIIAVYRSKHEDQEAKIIKAFRCNRITEKLEEIDVKAVKYKETDRDRITW